MRSPSIIPRVGAGASCSDKALSGAEGLRTPPGAGLLDLGVRAGYGAATASPPLPGTKGRERGDEGDGVREGRSSLWNELG